MRADRDANSESALQSLRTGVHVARKQGATALELRGAVSLARAGVEFGRPAEGVTALGELRAAPSSEFDTAQLREANGLLSSVPA